MGTASETFSFLSTNLSKEKIDGFLDDIEDTGINFVLGCNDRLPNFLKFQEKNVRTICSAAFTLIRLGTSSNIRVPRSILWGSTFYNKQEDPKKKEADGVVTTQYSSSSDKQEEKVMKTIPTQERMLTSTQENTLRRVAIQHQISYSLMRDLVERQDETLSSSYNEVNELLSCPTYDDP